MAKKLVPIKHDSKKPSFGCAKETVLFIGDIISPIHEKWNVDENIFKKVKHEVNRNSN